ncbi:phosphopantetheine-binding protein [Kitasatospora kifunensis]|uniref:Acyl carrier protein n=1 Tax=Kitasatospora kifunensis TaxID=58351 RepID=A0A7W7QWU1_KITKI|nr:phosphopantetheine-binding protein [Kitasatospora kifunensis]MBB4921202.1 acyl carrier protein [Kitasatospora kifunensis]
MARAEDIKKYLIQQFLLDVSVEELADDFDLLANGVIDSLGLLTLVSWLEGTYRLDIDALDVAPDNFRSVAAISAFLDRADAVPDGAR